MEIRSLGQPIPLRCSNCRNPGLRPELTATGVPEEVNETTTSLPGPPPTELTVIEKLEPGSVKVSLLCENCGNTTQA